MMKRLNWVLLLFALVSMDNDGPKKQGYTVKIFQYQGIDSLQRALAVTRVFNARNQLVFEKYHRNYYETSEGTTYRYGQGSVYFIYRDTLLIKTVGTAGGDSIRRLCFYNEKGQLVKSKLLRYEKKPKPTVDKGLGRPDGCIIVPKDFEKNRVWQEKSTSVFRYNSIGKLIERVILQGSTVSEKRWWSYYKSGKLREESSVDGDGTTPEYRTLSFYDARGRLAKEVSYSYGQMSATNIYHYNGNVMRLEGNYLPFPGADSASEYRRMKRMDSKGRLIEEVTYVGRCQLETRKLLRYRPDGKLAQTVLFTCQDSSRLVHDYVYTFR